MKKLHLVKPNLKTGYLNNGKGQEVEYIELSTCLGGTALEEDIKNGGKQFEELLEFSRKKPSRFVLINSANREDGLMAASYLAGIYNRADRVCAEMPEDSIDEKRKFDFEESDFFYDDMEDNWEENDYWEENPWRIPVLDIDKVLQADAYDLSYVGNVGFANNTRNNGNTPYWNNTRSEPIVLYLGDYTSAMFGGFMAQRRTLMDVCRRFQNNRHVYIVREIKFPELDWENSDLGGEPVMPFDFQAAEDDEIMEFILEYSAGVVNVNMDRPQRSSYRETVFKNLLSEYGYCTEKRFPFKKIIKTIESFRNPNKNMLMDKIVRYLGNEERETNVIAEKDLDFIRKFAHVSERDEDKKGLQKLRKEIVGMDAVKEQMLGIIEVMKYNKRRSEIGLGTGTFHNVHMLLGAPGTAKTTMAELLGKMMAEERLLKGNRFISVNGAELKGLFVGQTAPKVKALFDEYDIIMIDEAYSLASSMEGEMDSYGQEAIAQLIIELEKHGMDRLVLFAGYGGRKVTERDNKMKEFLNANPGIRSRINTTIYFDSYSPQEMLDIFLCHAKNNQFVTDEKAYGLIRDFFATRVDAKDFGNGREARSLLENVMIEAARRLAGVENASRKMLQELTAADVQKAIVRMNNAREEQLGISSSRCGFAIP